MNEHSFEGVVLVTETGKFLQIRERTTYTGHHADIAEVENLDEADVFLPGHLLQLEKRHRLELGTYFHQPARVRNTRSVDLL